MPTPLPVPTIAVVGSRKSGKTTAVETIVRKLTKKGYRVATAKHIHEPTFTVDAKNKDTWRHAQAGAQTIVGITPKELATIKKKDTTKYTLNDITQNCEDNIDIIILEGFRELVAHDLTVPKVVTVKNKTEMTEAMQTFKPILAFTGAISKDETKTLKLPVININEEPEKLIEIIEKRVSPIIQKRQGAKETLRIDINGKMLPLNSYVQKVTKKVLFAVISTLEGANIKGDENVSIKVTN